MNEPIMYHKLPGKGLGRSLDGVGLDQPVVITTTDVASSTWSFSEAEIKRRALELGAEVKARMNPSKSASDPDKYEFWFQKISENER